MEQFEKRICQSLKSVAQKVDALKKSDSLVFSVFTDLHTYDINHVYAQKLMRTLELISKEIGTDFAVDLGDNLGMLGRETHISNSDLKVVLDDLLDGIYKSAGCPLITVNGNHDAIGTDFFKADFWNSIVKGKFGLSDACYDKDGSYYFVDFEDTRFVVLSVPYGSDLYAEHPTPLWAFGDSQIKWLENTALDTDKYVILLCHVPFFDYYRGDMESMLEVWNGENTAMSYIANLCGWIEDCDKASEIINRFAESGNLIACFGGHTHLDSFWMPFEENDGFKNPVGCCQVVTEGVCIPAKSHEDYGVSVDIAIFTPSEKKLSIFRIGDGKRELSI